MTMYAEERQQAMAQLVAERGRLSVNVLAEEYDVTPRPSVETCRPSSAWDWSDVCTAAPSPQTPWP